MTLNFRSLTLKWTLLTLVLVLAGACQEAKKESPKADEVLTEAQTKEKARKALEQKQRKNARFRKMNIEHRKVQIASLSPTGLNLRTLVLLNAKPKQIVFSMPLNNQLKDQFGFQDKSLEIKDLFPTHNLEISAYQFKSGSIDMIALEYRFMRFTEQMDEASSQFVLMVLDPALQDKAILKTHFEFPAKTDLKAWAISTSKSVMETP